MNGDLETRLRAGASSVGVGLTREQCLAFGVYLDLLLEWNRRINLTSITDAPGVVDRHFVDSLALCALLPAGGSLLDVGSGAGFPGGVVAVVRPDVRVTLCESRAKRCAFLLALVARLKLNATVATLRSERLLTPHGARWDSVVSRAVAPLEGWVGEGAGLVASRGQLVAMATSLSAPPPQVPGFGPVSSLAYVLPDGSPRLLLSWRRSCSE